MNKEHLIDNNFCFAYNKYLNPTNKYREEKYIVFTSIFQLKKLAESNLIYMDGTFRTCPKNYYQLFNIIAKDKQTGKNIPVIHIPMSHKSEFLYNKIFENLVNIGKDLNIDLKMEKKTCMTDFDKGLRNSLRKVFEGINLRGCFFHYVKALWSKAKKLGLCAYNKIKVTKIIIFGLKVLTLQSKSCQDNMISEINKFIDEIEDNQMFRKYMAYYEKNWFKNSFIRFDLCYDKKIKIRTDNVCEGFHMIIKS